MIDFIFKVTCSQTFDCECRTIIIIFPKRHTHTHQVIENFKPIFAEMHVCFHGFSTFSWNVTSIWVSLFKLTVIESHL